MARSSLKAVRQSRLVDVAQAEFLLRGFRGTTMEGIAEAAGVSKVTIYSYFQDKEAAFAAVVERFADRLQTETLAALEADGSLADRVSGALVAKHGLVADTLRGSSFAAELLSQRHLGGDRFDLLDRTLIARIADAVGDARLGHILFRAAHGLASHALSREELTQDIRRLVSSCLKA